EFLNAMIAGVSNIQVVGAIHRDAARPIELTTRLSVPADLPQHIPHARQMQYAIVAGVRNVQRSTVVGGKSTRIVKLRLAVGATAPAGHQVPARVQLRDGV